jgi:hypothetical protein
MCVYLYSIVPDSGGVVEMSFGKHPSGDAASISMPVLDFPCQELERVNPVNSVMSADVATMADVDIDMREIYFLIMHFLSRGPFKRTLGELCNELLGHRLLPRRYHAWYSRGGFHSGEENDDGISLPLGYQKLAERYSYVALPNHFAPSLSVITFFICFILSYLFDIINICQGEDLSQFILQVINGQLQMLPICFQNRFEKKDPVYVTFNLGIIHTCCFNTVQSIIWICQCQVVPMYQCHICGSLTFSIIFFLAIEKLSFCEILQPFSRSF